MKKNFAIQAAKQLLNATELTISAKNESQNNQLFTSKAEKERICCPWLVIFTGTQREGQLAY